MTTSDYRTGGKLLAGRYRIGGLLGRGGMGAVWSGYDVLLHRDVAIKELMPAAGVNQQQRDDLNLWMLREARAAGRIDHPSAVTIFDVFQADDRPWIVMQLLNGVTLSDLIKDDEPIPLIKAIDISLDLLDAIQAAHRAGVLHRDIKPGNVIVTDSGRAVLTDFGIARIDDETTLSTSGMFVGSPGYMSPERARGENPAPACDLWSLGATLYSMTEGMPPFRRQSQLLTLTAVVNDPTPPAKHAGPLQPVIAQMLAKDRWQRPDATRTRELLRAVRADLAREAFSARPVPPSLQLRGLPLATPATGMPEVPDSAISSKSSQEQAEDGVGASAASVDEVSGGVEESAVPAAASAAEVAPGSAEDSGSAIADDSDSSGPDLKGPVEDNATDTPAEADDASGSASGSPVGVIAGESDEASLANGAAKQDSDAAEEDASVEAEAVEEASNDNAAAPVAIAPATTDSAASEGDAVADVHDAKDSAATKDEAAADAATEAAESKPASATATDRAATTGDADNSADADAVAPADSEGNPAAPAAAGTPATNDSGADSASGKTPAPGTAPSGLANDGNANSAAKTPGTGAAVKGDDAGSAAHGAAASATAPTGSATKNGDADSAAAKASATAAAASGLAAKSGDAGTAKAPAATTPATGTAASGLAARDSAADSATAASGSATKHDAAVAGETPDSAAKGAVPATATAASPKPPDTTALQAAPPTPSTSRLVTAPEPHPVAAANAAAPPPKPPRTDDHPLSPGKRRAVAALALAAVLVAAVLLVIQLRPGGDEEKPTPSATATATATELPAATAPSSSSPETTTEAPTPTPEATRTTSEADALPAGFAVRKDSTGFSIALPKSWNRSARGSSVYFRDPDSGAYLQVDTTTTPKPDALKDWQAAEPSAGQRFGNYKLISLERIEYRDYDAADWEYTWRTSRGTNLHVINRNMRISDRRAYALVWSVPESDWKSRQDEFKAVTKSFKPAK